MDAFLWNVNYSSGKLPQIKTKKIKQTLNFQRNKGGCHIHEAGDYEITCSFEKRLFGYLENRKHNFAKATDPSLVVLEVRTERGTPVKHRGKRCELSFSTCPTFI